jgi:hypothetical protein
VNGKSVRPGQAIARPPNPSKAGFYFVDWYSNADFSGGFYDFSRSIERDITLYARWSEEYWTVDFVSNRDDYRPETQRIGKGGGRALKPSDPVQNDTLNKWHIDNTPTSSKWDFGMPVNDNLTLYAIFTIHSLSLDITGLPAKTLTPLDNTDVFTVKISGFASNEDAGNVGLRITGGDGLTFSGYTSTNGYTTGDSKTFTVTVTYDRERYVPAGYSTVSVNLTGNLPFGYAYNDGNKSVNVSINDGLNGENPILLTQANIAAFNEFANTSYYSVMRHYKLAEDITLGSGWTAVNWFTGSFDGNNKMISNQSNSSHGLFFEIGYESIVKNINLNCNIIAYDYVGGIADRNYGTVQNCIVSGAVEYANSGISMIGAGGVVGENGGTVDACQFTGSVTGNFCVGGIVGFNRGEVRNCRAAGTVGGTLFVGGVVGVNDYGTVENCYALHQSIRAESSFGRVVGINNGTLSGNYGYSGMQRDGGTVTWVSDPNGKDGANYTP